MKLRTSSMPCDSFRVQYVFCFKKCFFFFKSPKNKEENTFDPSQIKLPNDTDAQFRTGTETSSVYSTTNLWNSLPQSQDAFPSLCGGRIPLLLTCWGHPHLCIILPSSDQARQAAGASPPPSTLGSCPDSPVMTPGA